MKNNVTLKICFAGIAAALSVVLVILIRIPYPIFPAYEYDPGDIPVLISAFVLGPVWGIVLTALVSVIQGVTVSAGGGVIGIVMHFFATSSFVIVSSIVYRKLKMNNVLSVVFGIIAQTLIMIPLNLVLTPLYYGIPIESVIEMILPVILPFNILKAGINGFLALFVFVPINNYLKKNNKSI